MSDFVELIFRTLTQVITCGCSTINAISEHIYKRGGIVRAVLQAYSVAFYPLMLQIAFIFDSAFESFGQYNFASVFQCFFQLSKNCRYL